MVKTGKKNKQIDQGNLYTICGDIYTLCVYSLMLYFPSSTIVLGPREERREDRREKWGVGGKGGEQKRHDGTKTVTGPKLRAKTVVQLKMTKSFRHRREEKLPGQRDFLLLFSGERGDKTPRIKTTRTHIYTYTRAHIHTHTHTHTHTQTHTYI